MTTPIDSPDDSEPCDVEYSVIAYRVESQAGWNLVQVDEHAETWVASQIARGTQIVEHIEIFNGLRRKTDGDSDDTGFIDLSIAFREGWSFDQEAKCWRAPGERILPPRGIPVAVESLEVRYSPPEVGWLLVSIVANGKEAQFEASELYDPFPDLIAWLEAIAEGEFPRFLIDQEGTHLQFLTIETTTHRSVRFLLAKVTRKPENEPGNALLDIEVNRRTLVDAFYGNLGRYAKSPDYKRDEWTAISLKQALERSAPLPPLDVLAQANAATLTKVFWSAWPMYEVNFPGDDVQKSLSKFVDMTFAEHELKHGAGKNPLRKIAQWLRIKFLRAHATETPLYRIEVPAEFNDWELKARIQYLEEALQEQVNSWSAADLASLRSEKIERWLGEIEKGER